MPRVWLLLPLLAGCVTGTGGGYVTPPESAARLPLRQKVVPLIEKLLKRDGWVGEVVKTEKLGVIASAAVEGWSEEEFILDVEARTPDGEPLLIPVADYTPILETLRKRLRDLVEDYGGEQVSWLITEAYRERALEFKYRQGQVTGRVRVRMTPKTDRLEELTTRVEVVVREQASGE